MRKLPMGSKKASCILNESLGKLPEVDQVLTSCIIDESRGKLPEVQKDLSVSIGVDNNWETKVSCILNESRRKLSEVERELSDLIGVDNNQGVNLSEDEPKPPESAWVISIKDKLERACQDNRACSWAKLSIYRIPHYLKDGEHKAYIPQIVSLGPYHHGKKRLRQMDRHKWRFLYRILLRTGHEISLYLNSVKELEERARACYEGTITMSSDKFVEMMVLDGCFVLELFRGFSLGFEILGHPHNDSVFLFKGSMLMIRRDMIMLENQIPLFILDRLFCLQLGRPDQTGLLAKLAFRFFYPLTHTGSPLNCPSNNRDRLEFDPLPHEGDLPCLELFRRSLLHPGPMQGSSQKRQQLIHCVTELRKKGIKFRKGETDRFWDIQFEDGTLKIPRLVIDDGTKSLFLNLIAFEQCHSNSGNDITAYVIFMDHLINSPEDVGHLHDRGIIEHWLGSDAEVAGLFNQLCKEVVFDINDSYLSELSGKVNGYSSHRWNGWIAILKLDYFRNPWSIISVIAAVFLLVLTFAQTFYGVYGYYRPGS